MKVWRNGPHENERPRKPAARGLYELAASRAEKRATSGGGLGELAERAARPRGARADTHGAGGGAATVRAGGRARFRVIFLWPSRAAPAPVLQTLCSVFTHPPRTGASRRPRPPSEKSRRVAQYCVLGVKRGSSPVFGPKTSNIWFPPIPPLSSLLHYVYQT